MKQVAVRLGAALFSASGLLGRLITKVQQVGILCAAAQPSSGTLPYDRRPCVVMKRPYLSNTVHLF